MTPQPPINHSDIDIPSQNDLLIVVPDTTPPLPPAASTEELSGSSSSLHSSPATSDPHSGHLLRPIPTPSVNASQASFSFSDASGGDNDGSGLFDPLSPEIASADISIAPDGSFVETSSGPAARELKRRYDQHFGVGKEIRSPYAITAFVNQHGKQMFRVGHRELSAPAAVAAEVEQLVATKGANIAASAASTPHTKRRSRLSVHGLIPPSLFKSGAGGAGAGTSSLLPQPAGAPRKLVRKTRSIPEMIHLNTSPQSSTQASPPSTGRIHSQSVTSADLPRLPSSNVASNVDVTGGGSGDLFGGVMHWPRLQNPSPHFSTQSLPGHGSSSSFDPPPKPTPAIIPHPFGPYVTFDSPSMKSTTHEHEHGQHDYSYYLPTPRHLREVQSFESGLTARQVDLEPPDPGTRSGDSPSPIPPGDHRDSVSPPPRVSSPDLPPPPSPPFGPAPETTLHSRYSTDVFDVLQTYRGLPLLDKLSPDSGETTVIRMSLGLEEGAAPRDDPRFVIWGEVERVVGDDGFSNEHGSFGAGGGRSRTTSASSASRSRRKSGKGKGGSDVVPKVRVSGGGSGGVGEGMQKVLVAATIERWIAQLTSDLNYDELLIFFLTYRTYISSVDLCHLLICRFHWALGKKAGEDEDSKRDEVVRRIVRVRTFVALRYWLLTFFVVDFLPNRELRMLLASWLNTLIRDPVLKKHSDGLSTVRKLSKVVKDCKKIHSKSSDKQPESKPKPKRNHVLGDKFAEAFGQEEDSDIDLDFGVDEGSIPTTDFQIDPINAHLTSVHVGAGLPTGPKPPALPTSPQRSRRSSTVRHDLETTFIQTPATLPIHHNSLSRAFTKTIGRLGRWKRVLNSRSPAKSPLSACADVSAFDLELTVSRDLLTVNGGVEQYLKMIEQRRTDEPSLTKEVFLLSGPNTDRVSSVATGSTAVDIVNRELPDVPVEAVEEDVVDITSQNGGTEAVGAEAVGANGDGAEGESVKLEDMINEPLKPLPAEPIPPVDSDTEYEDDDDEALSSRSSSTDSLGVPVSSRFMQASPQDIAQRPPWQFDVVSIDELDLSDTSSDHHFGEPIAPPGLRKQTRKLPLRRDFEFVPRESVSSMGITSHQSLVSVASSGPTEPGFGGIITPWQINALADTFSNELINEDETGDVEDALRRLEGQINPAKKQEKASKVDGWVKTIRERMAAGDYGNDYVDDYEDEAEEQSSDDMAEVEDDDDASTQSSRLSRQAVELSDSDPQVDPQTSQEPNSSPNAALESVQTLVSTSQAAHVTFAPTAVRSPDAKPAPEDAVPMEILQSRVPSQPLRNSLTKQLPAKFGRPDVPKVHRSFILSYRAETLVEHFSMIDRELFMGVKFEELVLDDWMSCEEVNVLDWGQFLKDRARWKAEHRWSGKTSALGVVRGRFNLMANFTLSEIVLTPPHERHIVVGKFIRMAWKAYCMNNFNTLVAIMAGLRSEWVDKAMRRFWPRVGMWETRMFKDLKEWTNDDDDFKFMRDSINNMLDAKPLDVNSHASVSSTLGTDDQSGKGRVASEIKVLPAACIPFIGVYLSQLYRYHKLPDLIDPTAPNEAVSVDDIFANFEAPAHPEVFSSLAPLPPSIQLEPLINVQKQRLIAGVIKDLVEGQHLASTVHFPVDKKLFAKCLRLRGLDTETLRRLLDNVS